MTQKKYQGFLEAAPVQRRGKFPPHALRNYVDITCPHCNTVCAEIPEELIKQTKASECLKHLRVCPSYTGPVSEAPAKKQKRAEVDSDASSLVTIYKIIFLPENRAVYTGRTNNIARRMRQHASKTSGCRLLRNAVRKHGLSKFTVEPIVRCRPADADANESHFIVANRTLYPEGYNLRHGAAAGREQPAEGDALVATGVVAFRSIEDELLARSKAFAEMAHLCADVEDDARVDDAVRDLLRQVHPDRAGGDRAYSAGEVTAMLNAVREAAAAGSRSE